MTKFQWLQPTIWRPYPTVLVYSKKTPRFLPKKTSDVQVNQWIFSGEVISTLGFFSLGTGAMLTPPSPSQPCRGGFHHPGKTCGSGGVVPLCVGPVPAASGAASWTCSNTRRHGGVATVWGRKMCKPQAVESIYTVVTVGWKVVQLEW